MAATAAEGKDPDILGSGGGGHGDAADLAALGLQVGLVAALHRGRGGCAAGAGGGGDVRGRLGGGTSWLPAAAAPAPPSPRPPPSHCHSTCSTAGQGGGQRRRGCADGGHLEGGRGACLEALLEGLRERSLEASAAPPPGIPALPQTPPSPCPAPHPSALNHPRRRRGPLAGRPPAPARCSAEQWAADHSPVHAAALAIQFLRPWRHRRPGRRRPAAQPAPPRPGAPPLSKILPFFACLGGHHPSARLCAVPCLSRDRSLPRPPPTPSPS